MNILLADDERSVAFSIAFALKADGHRTEIVSNGEEALAEIKAKPTEFDLLITDHSMPRMNGVELVKQLRDTAFRGKTVVLSAHLSAETTAAYLELGVDLMIPKPFDVHGLRRAIRHFADGGAEAARSPVRLSAPEVYRLFELALPENANPGGSEELGAS